MKKNTNDLLQRVINFYTASERCFSVSNPYDGSKIGSVKSFTYEEVEEQISLSYEHFLTWRNILPKTRASLLQKFYQLILQHIDDLAEIITYENGKVLSDARSEVLYGANFIDWFASAARMLHGNISDGTRDGQKIIMEYEPIGVVAAITPWNFPNAMITRKIAPVLAAGCSIIIKPSELTPFSAIALKILADEAGIPNGVINLVHGSSSMIGETLARNEYIKKITFTGSTKVGKLIHEQCGKNFKKVSLELGGNAPFIVDVNVDIDYVCDQLISAKIRSSGQSCTSPNRILIHTDIYEDFVEQLIIKATAIKAGNGFDDNNIGPLINKFSVERVMGLITDAINNGAQVVLGGEFNNNCLQMTIVKDCSTDARVFYEEIFAPILCCYRVNSVDEAISLANSSNYGLASYVFTNNIYTAAKVRNKLNYGIVGINQSIVSNEIGAFAGRNDSGIGVEGSHIGIFEFLQTKYVCTA